MQQFVVLGRRLPSEKEPNPEIYKMTIFAPNEIVAESRYWYFLNDLKKIKKSHGQTISVKKVVEDESEVKNYAVQLRYRDCVGHHNMYREVREVCPSRAMQAIFHEMAGQYHVQYRDIQIIKFDEIKNHEDIRREKVLMMMPTEHHEVKFPHPFPESHGKRLAREHRFAKKVFHVKV